jgi:hypothetical protein
MLPDFRPQWNVRRGIEQLYSAYREQALTAAEFTGTRYIRIKHLTALLQAKCLDSGLHWVG